MLVLSLNAFLKGPQRHNFTRLVTTTRSEQALVFTGQLDTVLEIDLGVDKAKHSFKNS